MSDTGHVQAQTTYYARSKDQVGAGLSLRYYLEVRRKCLVGSLEWKCHAGRDSGLFYCPVVKIMPGL